MQRYNNFFLDCIIYIKTSDIPYEEKTTRLLNLIARAKQFEILVRRLEQIDPSLSSICDIENSLDRIGTDTMDSIERYERYIYWVESAITAIQDVISRSPIIAI